MSDGIKKIIVNLDTLQSKTSKKQTKKRPTIVPNRLKDTFLKQVQHHKSLANAQKQKPPAVDQNKYTDDFHSSVEYLNNIKKTVQQVHSELPEELLEPTVEIVPKLVEAPRLVESPTTNTTTTTTAASVPTPTPTLTPTKYKVDSEVPYGCLKNGIKPSFKNWTRNNRSASMNTANPALSFSAKPSQSSVSVPVTVPAPAQQQPPQQPTPQMQTPVASKPATTIKRHVIGKSKKSRHVGVLIKNVNTRKHIINAHKDLKKTNINEVRNHLKNNGLLKVGTTAPIEVLRQTYEASILAGDINNKNHETLYHNFINDKEKEKEI